MSEPVKLALSLMMVRPPENDQTRHATYCDLERGLVPRNTLQINRARDEVWKATWPFYETREEAEKFYSPLEGDMLAAFRYYNMEPELQVEFGRYRVDFLFRREHVVVEVDGRDWHKNDRERDSYLHDTHDLIVKRFNGQVVYNDPLRCAINVRNTVVWISERLNLVKGAA